MNTKILISATIIILTITGCKKEENKNNTNNTSNNITNIASDTIGLVFAYNFNLNLKDSSHRHNDLNIAGSSGYYYTSNKNGIPNKAVGFTGAGQLALPTDQSIYKISLPLTLSFWLNVPDSAANNRFFYSDNNSFYAGYWAQTSSAWPGKIAFSIGDNAGSNYLNRKTAVSSINLTNNTWHHVLAVIKNANEIDIYINGTKDLNVQYDGSATQLNYSAGSGFIGALPYLPQYLTGKMDKIKLWKRALSASEVNAEFLNND